MCAYRFVYLCVCSCRYNHMSICMCFVMYIDMHVHVYARRACSVMKFGFVDLCICRLIRINHANHPWGVQVHSARWNMCLLRDHRRAPFHNYCGMDRCCHLFLTWSGFLLSPSPVCQPASLSIWLCNFIRTCICLFICIFISIYEFKCLFAYPLSICMYCYARSKSDALLGRWRNWSLSMNIVLAVAMANLILK